MTVYDQVRRNPAKYFEHPQDVISCGSLMDIEKRDVLKQWEREARLMSVEQNETKTGDRQPLISAIHEALESV